MSATHPTILSPVAHKPSGLCPATHSFCQVKAWAKLLQSVCSTARLELELLYHVQVQCYEDAKLQRVFPEFIRTLYDLDVLAEDSILLWFHKGTNAKGRWVGGWVGQWQIEQNQRTLND